MTLYRCPDGTTTTKVKKYISEWEAITSTFEALGFHVIGFDPGILLCGKDGDGKPFVGDSFDLPMYAVRILINKIKRGKT